MEETIIVRLFEPLPEIFERSFFLYSSSLFVSAIDSFSFSDFGSNSVVFLPLKPADSDEQSKEAVMWENSALNMSDMILIWLPVATSATELASCVLHFGRWVSSGRIIYGREHLAEGEEGVEKATGHALFEKLDDLARCEGIKINTSFAECLEGFKAKTKNGALRQGVERNVPLHVWNHVAFKDWYANMKSVGNRLDGAALKWAFCVGPNKAFTLYWVLHVDIWVASESRNKSNEIVLARSDIKCVFPYYLPEDDEDFNELDCEVVLIREFRSPGRTVDGFIHELPGGSAFKAKDPLVEALDELRQETSLVVSDKSRVNNHGARQISGTTSAHQAHLFSIQLTWEEIEKCRQLAAANTPLGNAAETEKTYVEVFTLRDLLSSNIVDWSGLGMIHFVLHEAVLKAKQEREATEMPYSPWVGTPFQDNFPLSPFQLSGIPLHRDGSLDKAAVSQESFSEVYCLGELIRQGDFSNIHCCTHQDTKADCVAKIFEHAGKSRKEIAGIGTEILILHELRHPNIIHLLEVFEEQSRTILVLELVIGGDLFDRIATKTVFTEKDARDLVALLLRTVAYIHGKGIVHCDLKPENLLLTTQDDNADIKVCDFSAASFTNNIQEGAVFGSPPYVSPERLMQMKYTEKTDIWSIGVITFVLLGGYLPFYDEDYLRLFDLIRQGKYEFDPKHWDSISDDAKNIIQEMLEYEHTQRKSAAELLEHKWILTENCELLKRDLSVNLKEFGAFNGKRRMKAVTDVVIAVNRLRRGSSIGEKSNSGSERRASVDSSHDFFKANLFERVYNLGEEIAVGRYSKIYHCTNKETKEEWAAKVVKHAELPKEELEALQVEIDILRQLSHPNVIKLHEMFVEETETILVLELVMGGTLFDQIVQKDMYTEEEVRELVVPLLSTVSYIHENQIVHRDLKPENILLTTADDSAGFKICDFNFAAFASQIKKGEGIGTHGYASPEMCTGSEHSTKTDIWSIGVIVYILLGGYVPFHGADQSELSENVCQGHYEFHSPQWDRISESAKDFVKQMLEVDQNKRKSADELLQHEWIVGGQQLFLGRGQSQDHAELRKDNDKQTLRSIVQTVIAIARFRRLVQNPHAKKTKRKLFQLNKNTPGSFKDV